MLIIILIDNLRILKNKQVLAETGIDVVKSEDASDTYFALDTAVNRF